MKKKDKFFRSFNMEDLNILINRFLNFEGFDKNIKLYQIVIFYNNLSEDIRLGSKAWSLRQGKLFVETDNNSISNLLSLKKTELLDKINKNFNRDVVKDIIFSVSK